MSANDEDSDRRQPVNVVANDNESFSTRQVQQQYDETTFFVSGTTITSSALGTIAHFVSTTAAVL